MGQEESNKSSNIKWIWTRDSYGRPIQALPVTNYGGINNITLPDLVVTPRNNMNLGSYIRRGRSKINEDIVLPILDFTPIGDAKDVYNIGKDIYNQNYSKAAAGVGLMLLPNAVLGLARPLVRRTKKWLTAGKRLDDLSNKISDRISEIDKERHLAYDTLNLLIDELLRAESAHMHKKLRIEDAMDKQRSNNNHRYGFGYSIKYGDPEKMSDLNISEYLSKHVDPNRNWVVSNGVVENNQTLLNLFTNAGEFSLPIYGTNELVKGTLKAGPFNSSDLTNYDFRKGKNLDVTLEQLKVDIPQNYREGLLKNIEYLKNLFPGFKPFGSAVGVTELGLPHITHDIDGFITDKQFNKLKGFNPQPYRWDDNGNPITYKINIGKLYGDAGDIDLNIVYTDPKTGKATGRNAEELYRQFFPEARHKAVVNEIEGKPFVIDKTPEEIMEAYDPATKTMLDSFEIDFNSPGKAKHAGRPIMYMSYGNPQKVSAGLNLFARSTTGINLVAPIIDPKYFSNKEENLKLLLSWNTAGDLNSIASDPAKMLNAFNYFMLNNSVLSRGVDNNPAYIKNLTDFQNAFRVWKPESVGGNANGAGLNTVTFGNSGWGTHYGYLRPLLRIKNMTNPTEITNAIKHLFGTLEFNDNEKLIVELILKKYNINRSVKSPDELLDVIPPTGDNANNILKELSKSLGIDAITRNRMFGTGKYTSTTRPYTELTDYLFYGRPRDPRPLSSYTRKEAIDRIKTEQSKLSGINNARKGLIEGRFVESPNLYRNESIMELLDFRSKVLNRLLDTNNQKLTLLREKSQKAEDIYNNIERDYNKYDHKIYNLRNKIGSRLEKLKTAKKIAKIGGAEIAVGTAALTILNMYYKYKNKYKNKLENNENKN